MGRARACGAKVAASRPLRAPAGVVLCPAVEPPGEPHALADPDNPPPFSSQRPPPSSCNCCSGSGSADCAFCRGSGALTVGGERFCSLEAGCKGCPACAGRGAVPCRACAGTGLRASWLGPGCPAE